MELQLESVRKLKIRKHRFISQLNEIGYLINIEDIEPYVNKANEIRKKIIRE
jgi:hypothetical protein